MEEPRFEAESVDSGNLSFPQHSELKLHRWYTVVRVEISVSMSALTGLDI